VRIFFHLDNIPNDIQVQLVIIHLERFILKFHKTITINAIHYHGKHRDLSLEKDLGMYMWSPWQNWKN